MWKLIPGEVSVFLYMGATLCLAILVWMLIGHWNCMRPVSLLHKESAPATLAVQARSDRPSHQSHLCATQEENAGIDASRFNGQPREQGQHRASSQRGWPDKAQLLIVAHALCEATSRNHVEEIRSQLAQLSAALNAMQGSGREGQLALTDFANALVEADSLWTLEVLQRHADKILARMAKHLLEQTAPLIWNF